MAFGFSDYLDSRQLKELEFCKLYAKDFHHGTTGHNAMMLVATLAELLEKSDPSNVARREQIIARDKVQVIVSEFKGKISDSDRFKLSEALFMALDPGGPFDK